MRISPEKLIILLRIAFLKPNKIEKAIKMIPAPKAIVPMPT
jgi:hypothetical protein